MRKQIFKAIADAVAAVPGVAFVDLWNNQVQLLNGGSAFPVPAVFIEFEQIDWKQQNMGARRGALAVRLHVVTRAVPTHGHNDPRIGEALAAPLPCRPTGTMPHKRRKRLNFAPSAPLRLILPAHNESGHTAGENQPCGHSILKPIKARLKLR